MITEIVDIRIKLGQQAAFEQAMAHGLRTIHAKAAGRRGWQLYRCVETPDRYVMHIGWDSIDAHQAYRQTPLSPELRALVAPFLAQPNVMEHFELAASDD